MDVVFAVNDAFCQYAAVAIQSLFCNNRAVGISVYIFEIECSASNINKLTSLVEANKGKPFVYHIASSLFSGFPFAGMYSLACYLRLCAPELLAGIDKVLYLDSDLVVTGSIADLWNIDIEGYSMAAVHDAVLSYGIAKDYIGYDYFKEGYANSGVLLMNLKYWREHDVQRRLFDFLSTHDVKLPDQDALNAVLHGTVKFVHPRWNCHTGFFSLPPLVVGEQRRYIKEMWRGARIAHFTGPAKPWYRECVNPYKRVYLKYKRMTPWCNVPQRQLEGNAFRSVAIVVLRHCKNIMARLLSYTYR